MVGGTLRGDGARVIEGAAGLGEATEKDISFLGNAKYLGQLSGSKAGAFLLPPEAPDDGRPAVLLKNPPYGWAKVLEVLERERVQRPAGIHPTAVVAASAKIGAGAAVGAYSVVEANAVIGENTVIYPHVYVGHDVKIGRDCLIYPHVTLRERVNLGARVILQPGVVIGSDGFGFVFHEGAHRKIPQIGGVVIGDDVEIQANTTIDRAAIGATTIGAGTKVDNLVQIAHNVEIGKHCLIVALCGIAGSTKLGNYVTMGAQVGVAGHIAIGDGTMVGAKSGVTHTLGAKEAVWGLPAHPIRDELKVIAAVRQLPKFLTEWKALKKKMGWDQ